MATISEILDHKLRLHRESNREVSYTITSNIALFLDQTVTSDMITLETGSGVSTLCFMVKGSNHTVIDPDDSNHDRILDQAQQYGLDTTKTEFIAAPSQDVLPALTAFQEKPFLDLALI